MKKISKYEPTKEDIIRFVLSYNPSSSLSEIRGYLGSLERKMGLVFNPKLKMRNVLKDLEKQKEIQSRFDGKKNETVYELTKHGKYHSDIDLIKIADEYKGKDYSNLGKILFHLKIGDTIVPSTG